VEEQEAISALGQKQKSANASAISALPLTKDELLQIADVRTMGFLGWRRRKAAVPG
jgi:hypothetical protein